MNPGDEARQLWCAVITQAIDDATCPIGPKRQRNTEIMQARAWLTSPNRDFAAVCRLAGFEPDRVRAQITRRIDQAALLDCPPPPIARKPRAPRIKTTNEGQQANAER